MQKQKILKFQAKNVLFGIFRLKLKQMIVIFGIITLDFAEMQKMVQNKKKNKKQIWDQKCLIWIFWVVSLKKYCHIFSILEFVKLQSFVQN